MARVTPGTPVAPVYPAAPLAPVHPAAPLSPVPPAAPLSPVPPAAQLAPVHPVAPLAPVHAVAHLSPADPSAPGAPGSERIPAARTAAAVPGQGAARDGAVLPSQAPAASSHQRGHGLPPVSRQEAREQSEPSTTAASSPLGATLSVLRGPDAGRRFVLAPGTVVIGRGKEATIRLGDRRASRAHVSLAVGPDGVMVLDLGAKNGVFLGRGRLLAPELLRTGDELLIGMTVLRYQDAQSTPRFRPRIVGPADDPLPRIRDDVAFGILCAAAFTAGAVAFAVLG